MTASIPPLVWALLVFTPLMIAIGQLIFKLAGQKLLTSNAPMYLWVFEPYFLGACVLYAGATFLWVYVLRVVPLAMAYSFMALTFVMVPVLATFVLGESLGFKYVIGAAFIIIGLVIVQT